MTSLRWMGLAGLFWLGGTAAVAVEESSTALQKFTLDRVEVRLPDGSREQSVKLGVEYCGRRVWTGTAPSPGTVRVPLEAATDFNAPPRRGYPAPERIFLYVESDACAGQWHYLRKDGEVLVPERPGPIQLRKRKYAVVEYAFYQGDDPRFEGREPTFSGVAAVGHWGALPGFEHDTLFWMGGRDGQLWGDELQLHFHRISQGNGAIDAGEVSLAAMTGAPEDGYEHYQTKGRNTGELRVGHGYYFRIYGHMESLRGYGKMYVREVTETVPKGLPLFERRRL